MTRRGEEGVALVISLFLMAAMSALAVSLMFLAQTETSASRNYRTMSQARYAGEAGVHKTLNYFTNTYTAPATLSSFVTTVSPVTYNGQPVILSSVAGTSSNYPDSTIASAYSAATQGSLAVGSGTVGYGAIAKLLQMRTVQVYGGGSGVIQTWEIVASGTVPGAIPATVEVKAILERDLVDAQTFAVFATGTGCGAITMQGNVATGSYDSQQTGHPTSDSGGNLGTNGNLAIGGSVNVYGSLSSPRAGVGTCDEGNVTALSMTGSVAPPSAGSIKLPQPITFPPPALPSPMPPTGTMTGAAICAAVTLPALCGLSGTTVTIDPMGTTVRLGNISGNVVLKGGNYSINSMGAGDLTVGTSMAGTTNVVINLAGKTSTGGDLDTVMDMGGNNISNPSLDPQRLQILYAGTGTINMRGGPEASMMMYAPNANVETYGNADIFGSVLTKTLETHGNTRFFYDRRMSSTFQTFGNYVMSSFSWRKY
jgi:Tfp pilus assembly protein PilX